MLSGKTQDVITRFVQIFNAIEHNSNAIEAEKKSHRTCLMMDILTMLFEKVEHERLHPNQIYRAHGKTLTDYNARHHYFYDVMVNCGDYDRLLDLDGVSFYVKKLNDIEKFVWNIYHSEYILLWVSADRPKTLVLTEEDFEFYQKEAKTIV